MAWSEKARNAAAKSYHDAARMASSLQNNAHAAWMNAYTLSSWASVGGMGAMRYRRSK